MIVYLKISDDDAAKLGQVLLSRGIIVGATGKYVFRNSTALYTFQNRGLCCGYIVAAMRGADGSYPSDAWRVVWCVLVGRQLECFVSSSDPKPLYAVDLQNGSVHESAPNGEQYFIEIQTEAITLGFRAKSASELMHWSALLTSTTTQSCSENELIFQAEATITAWAYRHSSINKPSSSSSSSLS